MGYTEFEKPTKHPGGGASVGTVVKFVPPAWGGLEFACSDPSCGPMQHLSSHCVAAIPHKIEEDGHGC